MRSIPGAMIVAAGAGLLTISSLASIRDSYLHVNLVVGLALCAFGLLGPASKSVSSADESRSVRFVSWRFSIRDLL